MGALFGSIATAFVPNSTGGPVLVIAKPSGLAVGDLMVGSVYLNTGLASTINFPAGWTKLDQREPTIGNPKGAIGFKIANAADVAATDFTFTHSEGGNREWVGAITRYTGGLNIGTFTSGVVNDLSGQSTIAYPGHTTVADNTLIHRTAGFDFTGVEATSIGLTALHTRRATDGGPLAPGPSDTQGVWDELNAIVTPPGFVNAANFTQTGGTGNLRAVLYTLTVAPVLAFQSIAEAEATSRDNVAAGTWVNAHSQITQAGAFSSRAQRFMSPANPDNGEWVDILDPATI